jgi:hypothetical protein
MYKNKRDQRRVAHRSLEQNGKSNTGLYKYKPLAFDEDAKTIPYTKGTFLTTADGNVK